MPDNVVVRGARSPVDLSFARTGFYYLFDTLFRRWKIFWHCTAKTTDCGSEVIGEYIYGN